MSGRLRDDRDETDGPGGSRDAPLSVSTLNETADDIVRSGLGTVWVRGEVGRFTVPASGHWYFTLKDDDASISAAMFRTRNRAVRFEVREGVEILALATPGVYAPRGQFQLIVESMEPVGRGSARLAFERLRATLEREGLTSDERKRPLPLVPRRVGVVTSATGAALRDVLRVLHRRHAGVGVLLYPSPVQGPEAAEQLARGLEALDGRGVEVILLVRGGGAYEDLAAFNDEALARVIAACGTPVVTGIGHEIDVTIADLVADLRAATPSAAAEQVAGAASDLSARIAGLRRRVASALRARLAGARMSLREIEAVLGEVPARLQTAVQRTDEAERRVRAAMALGLARIRGRVSAATGRLSPAHHRGRVALRGQRLGALDQRLDRTARARTATARRRLATVAARLQALSPLAVLSRGFALVTRPDAAGTLVTDAATVEPEERLDVRLARGRLRTRVDATLPPEDTETA